MLSGMWEMHYAHNTTNTTKATNTKSETLLAEYWTSQMNSCACYDYYSASSNVVIVELSGNVERDVELTTSYKVHTTTGFAISTTSTITVSTSSKAKYQSEVFR